MSSQDERRRSYLIPLHLNKGKRLSGLPIDEVLPALIFFLIFFAAGKYLTGVAIGTIWFLGLRSLKVKYGENIIQLAIYWYGAASVSQSFFNRTPPATRRYWIF